MARIDERDQAILLGLLEHKVLTTDQIKSLYFRSLRRCQHRLKELRDLGLVASFTPRRGFGEGRPPDCLLLTKAGLSEIAEAKGVRASDLSWIPDEGYRQSHNLAHRLGVNAFFCALVEASRIHEGHCLATWRPEHWVRTRSAPVKPDGFGRYLHPGGACEFYLEYDRGTEAFGALSAKLEGYLRLAAGWTEEGDVPRFPNVLFIVPEGVREGEVGSALGHAIQRVQIRTPLAASFPLYVASEDRFSQCGVLGDVWRHAASDGERTSLLDLPAQPADLYGTSRCLGRYFTGAVADRWRRIAPASAPPRFSVLADPIEPDGRAGAAERAGEHLGVVGEDLLGHPVAGQGLHQGLAQRSGGGPGDQLGDHAEPGVVVDAGDRLALGAVFEQHPAHHVHLPHLLANVALRLRIGGGFGRGRPVASVLLLGLLPVARVVPALTALGLVAAVCASLIGYEAIRYREGRAWIRSRRGAFTMEEAARAGRSR